MSKAFPADVLVCVLLNVVSVVGVVIVNKYVYTHGFNFPTTLMMMHFICTWLFVIAAKKARWFTDKRVPRASAALLGFTQVASVAFVNLSLLHNSVGTYQLFKFTNVFVTCVIEYMWLKKVYSAGIYASIAVLVLGVCVATVSSVNFSRLGILHGSLGSVTTAVYQIITKKVQTENDVSALQLLQHAMPYSGVFAALFAVFSDNLDRLPETVFTPTLTNGVIASCILAFGVNLTTFLIIGKTSPLTYSVVGHTKTVGVMLVGFLVFDETTSPKHFFGLCLAFAGIVVYTHLSSRPGSIVSAGAPIVEKPQTPAPSANASASPTTAGPPGHNRAASTTSVNPPMRESTSSLNVAALAGSQGEKHA